jgi:dihydropteroate synthase
VELFGVVNASPDSLHAGSIVRSPDEAVARGRALLADGAVALDLGGQGTTFVAEEVAEEEEWARVAPLVPALAGLGVPLSIDTFRPEVARRALAAGATWLNAADGLQGDELARVAADAGCPVVLPFLNGPSPLALAPVESADPMGVLVEWFDAALRRLDAFGLRSRCVLDPGTGFAPHDLAWEDRFPYQKRVRGPRPAPHLRAPPLHRPAVAGHPPARGAARHRPRPRPRVRAGPRAGPHPRGRDGYDEGAPIGASSRQHSALSGQLSRPDERFARTRATLRAVSTRR